MSVDNCNKFVFAYGFYTYHDNSFYFWDDLKVMVDYVNEKYNTKIKYSTDIYYDGPIFIHTGGLNSSDRNNYDTDLTSELKIEFEVTNNELEALKEIAEEYEDINNVDIRWRSFNFSY